MSSKRIGRQKGIFHIERYLMSFVNMCGIVTKEEKTFFLAHHLLSRCEDTRVTSSFWPFMNWTFHSSSRRCFYYIANYNDELVLRYRLGHLRDDSDARLQSEIAIDFRVSGKNEGVAGVHKKAVRRLAT